MVKVAVWNDRGKRMENPVVYEGEFRQYKKDNYTTFFMIRNPETHESVIPPLYNFGRPIFMKEQNGTFEMGFIGENWEYDNNQKMVYKQRWDITFGKEDRGDDDVVIAETISVANSPKIYNDDELLL